MTKTTNYQLNQWAKTDRILMDDFNADNAIIDAALAAHAAKLAGCGNCKIEYGAYRGSNQYDRQNPNTLTFSGRPLFIGVFSDAADILFMQQGAKYGRTVGGSADRDGPIDVDWSIPNTVKWFSTKSAQVQMNLSTPYQYFALMAADAE